MKINTIGHLVKTNPIQTQTNPILSAVGGFRKRQNRLPENPATFQQTKKNLWTIPKRTIIMISSYKLSISDL